MKKVLSAAALLGVSGFVNAAPEPATLTQVLSYSTNGNSIWSRTADTSTWTFDAITGTAVQTGGTYTGTAKVGATPLMTHTMTGATLGSGPATATTWACIEGTFGTVVGASICGNYNFGINATNESIYTPTTTGGAVVLGGDDVALPGGVQTLANAYSSMLATNVGGNVWKLSNKLPDGSGGYDFTFTITGGLIANAVNDGPITAPQTVPTVIPVGANDVDFSDPVTVTVNTNPQHGTITAISATGPAADQTITYTANAGYLGADSFTYTMTGGNGFDSATVNINVTAAFSAAADFATTAPNRPVIIFVGGNDSGFDNTVNVTLNSGSFSAGGSAAVTAGQGGPASGIRISYTPQNGFRGDETFTYTIDDGSRSDTASVTVTVTDPTPRAATLISVTSQSTNGASNWSLSANTATWTFDPVTGVALQTGGTYQATAKVGVTPLMTHTMTGASIGGTANASATTWACIEGTFGGVVGASICGNYNFGANATNDSTYSPTTTGATVVLGGDDGALPGGPQTLANSYNNMTATAITGAAPGLQRYRISNSISLQSGYDFVFEVTHLVDAADDGPISAAQSVATVIPIGANDIDFSNPVTVTIIAAPTRGEISAVSPPGSAASQTITYTADADATGTDTFVYRMTDANGVDSDTATVAINISAPKAKLPGGSSAFDLWSMSLLGGLSLLRRFRNRPGRGPSRAAP